MHIRLVLRLALLCCTGGLAVNQLQQLTYRGGTTHSFYGRYSSSAMPLKGDYLLFPVFRCVFGRGHEFFSPRFTLKNQQGCVSPCFRRCEGEPILMDDKFIYVYFRANNLGERQHQLQ